MNLPQHWRLGSVAELIEGIDSGKNLRCEERPPTSKEVGIVKISAVTWGTFDATKSKTVVSGTQLPDSTRIRAGDLLMSRANTLELVGATVLVEEAPNNLHLSDKVLRLRAKPGWQKWLNIFLNSVDGRSEIESRATGNQLSMRNIGQDAIRNIALPIPPLPEQRRIVARIEALFARTRRARTDLLRGLALASALRKASSAKAFTGELLRLDAIPHDYEIEGTWPLPLGWLWLRFAEVAEVASNLVAPSTIPNLPHLAPDNVEPGTGKLLPCKTIAEAEVISPKHRFFSGQIVYSKIRPYLRKAVLVDFEGGCSADMYPLTVRSGIDPTYLLHWLISEDFARFTSDHEGRTVLPKINQQGLARTLVPVPPLHQQREIGSRLSEVATRTEATARDVARNLALLDRLEQSILAHAFRGELVPQEPAEAAGEIAPVTVGREVPVVRRRRTRAVAA